MAFDPFILQRAIDRESVEASLLNDDEREDLPRLLRPRSAAVNVKQRLVPAAAALRDAIRVKARAWMISSRSGAPTCRTPPR